MKEYPVGTLRPASFRWQAFGIHLGISLVILGIMLYVLLVHWFPGFLFETDGGWQALKVIAGVDIVLGPLLTLIAANPAKTTNHLRKDFSVIALIQVAALSAGTWIAWDNRPYAMLWYDGAFRSMPYSAFSNEPQAKAWIEEHAERIPALVYVEMPEDAFTRADVLQRARDRGSMAMFDASLFRTWPGDAGRVHALAAAALPRLAADAAFEQRLTEWETRQGYRRQDVLLIPTSSRYRRYVLALSGNSLAILDFVNIVPHDTIFQAPPDQVIDFSKYR